VLHGKELSYNNLLDVSAAIQLIGEFDGDDPTVAILKHTNPCGVARSSSLLGAWHQAFATDQQSPFGGIVVVNQSLDAETAAAIDAIFTEIIIAPAFDEDALALLKAKKNRRLVLNKQHSSAPAKDVRSVVGGILVQDADAPLPRPSGLRAQLSVSTTREPSEAEWRDLDFAWRIVKHVKSNAIVYVKNEATIGIGAGQMSRIDASEIAVAKGKKSGCSFEGCVVASDAFFPFADGLIAAAEAGARAAIQPGGSVRDAEVIAAANERGMAMVFTGKRHFRH
jgi:phosphoribosylaminoimidazolecarboxamide formyltransferase/IMP cyclohydrolase